MGAKRALSRWGWRLLRQEWQEQLLILGLITVSIAMASVLATALFHAEQPASTFTGDATHRIYIFGDESETFEEKLARAQVAFPSVEVTRSVTASRDGSGQEFLIEAPPFTSALGAEPVRMIEGRRPQSEGEIAVSTSLAVKLRVPVEATLVVNGQHLTVVGLMEDPSTINRDFAISHQDHLVRNGRGLTGTDVAETAQPQTTQPELDPRFAAILVQSTRTDLIAFLDENSSTPGYIEFSNVQWLHDIDDGSRRVAQLAVFLMSTIVMLEIALLCSAGFVVLGQRRIRQFGLLSAVGATQRHLRQALRLNGLALGLTGGVLGVGLGYGLSLLARPLFERLLTQRIQTWSVPWLILLPLVGLAGATGLLAAWLPARGLSRIPIVDALAARQPVGRSTARWGAVGGLAFVGGAVMLSSAVGSSQPKLAAVGLVLAILGLLMLTPALTSLAGRLAPLLPLSPRIALRDLARHPNRTAAALAALVIALGIPVGVILTSTSADANLDNAGPNLPDNWAIIMPTRTLHFSGDAPAGLGDHSQELQAIRAALPLANLTEIQIATSSSESIILVPDHVAVATAMHCQGSTEEYECRSGPGDTAWVATPILLQALGLDPVLATEATTLLSNREEAVNIGFDWVIANSAPIQPTPANLTPYRAVPNYFIPEVSMAEQGYEPILVGWLLTNPTAITADQAEQLFAAVAGGSANDFTQVLGQGASRPDESQLAVEVQQPDQNDDDIRRNVLIVGVLVSLTIIAAMVSLLRVDSARDDRALAVIGAPSATRRKIVASTTAFLGLGGSLLALPGGYLALVAITSDRDGGYPYVFPASQLAILLIGAPLLATLIAAILVRRQPDSLVTAIR